MIVGEYLERFSPSVRPRTRVTEIEGEAKEVAAEVKMFEGEEVRGSFEKSVQSHC